MAFTATQRTQVKVFISSDYWDEAAKEYSMWLRMKTPNILDVAVTNYEGYLTIVVTYE